MDLTKHQKAGLTLYAHTSMEYKGYTSDTFIVLRPNEKSVVSQAKLYTVFESADRARKKDYKHTKPNKLISLDDLLLELKARNEADMGIFEFRGFRGTLTRWGHSFETYPLLSVVQCVDEWLTRYTREKSRTLSEVAHLQKNCSTQVMTIPPYLGSDSIDVRLFRWA